MNNDRRKHDDVWALALVRAYQRLGMSAVIEAAMASLDLYVDVLNEQGKVLVIVATSRVLA